MQIAKPAPNDVASAYYAWYLVGSGADVGCGSGIPETLVSGCQRLYLVHGEKNSVLPFWFGFQPAHIAKPCKGNFTLYTKFNQHSTKAKLRFTPVIDYNVGSELSRMLHTWLGYLVRFFKAEMENGDQISTEDHGK